MSILPKPHPPIEHIPAADRERGLRLLFSHLSATGAAEEADVLISAADEGIFPLDGLLGVRAGERLIGAVLAQVQPGRTGSVWMPRTASDRPRDLADRLIEAACGYLAQNDVRTAQAILEKPTAADDKLLVGAGFRRLTDLLYMVGNESTFPSSPPETSLEFEPYRLDIHERFAAIVEATYEDTLDCPELDGVRPIEEVLDGYRKTGAFDPDRWLIVRHAGEDVGCLLMADHPQHSNWELVYMGLTASARGHGWGKNVARQGQWMTALAGRPRFVVAVDAGNSPAVGMYEAVGFREWDRRTVYVKVLKP